MGSFLEGLPRFIALRTLAKRGAGKEVLITTPLIIRTAMTLPFAMTHTYLDNGTSSITPLLSLAKRQARRAPHHNPRCD